MDYEKLVDKLIKDAFTPEFFENLKLREDFISSIQEEHGFEVAELARETLDSFRIKSYIKIGDKIRWLD